jgi:hypothetical protein
MNDVYFACEDCGTLVDAGYRWAYWELEHRGVVKRRERVSARAVEAVDSYWNPPAESESKWLTDAVLPRVRSFLAAHGEHRLTYGDIEDVVGTDPTALFDWVDVSYLPELTPRYFVDVLGLVSWTQVLEWGKTADRKPWWWDEPDLKDCAQRRLVEIASSAAQPAVAADGASPRR